MVEWTNPHTPTIDDIRRGYIGQPADGFWDPLVGEEFDRWLKAHDAEVRAENREAVIKGLIDCYFAGDKNTYGLSAMTPEWLRAVLRDLNKED